MANEDCGAHGGERRLKQDDVGEGEDGGDGGGAVSSDGDLKLRGKQRRGVAREKCSAKKLLMRGWKRWN